MNRRRAITAAAVITMSVMSGTAALGAHFGALGLGHAPATSAAAAASSTPAAATNAASTTHHGDDGPVRTTSANHEQGERR